MRRNLSSLPLIGRVIPRVGVSLALAASLLGVGAGQLVVHAQDDGVTVDGAKVPFIVCGVDTRLESGGTQSILLTSEGAAVIPAQIDPAAIGATFRIHGQSVADCGAGVAFKGLADRYGNAGAISLPTALVWQAGTRPQQTSNQMDSFNCADASQGCTLLVPVATGSDGAHLEAVVWAVMVVTTTGGASHSGLLLGDSSVLAQQSP